MVRLLSLSQELLFAYFNCHAGPEVLVLLVDLLDPLVLILYLGSKLVYQLLVL